jgi:hypothetical protein
MDMMSGQRPKKKTSAEKVFKEPAGAVLFVRLDDATRAAIQAFIRAQTVPPDRSSVARQALHEFLRAQGFWPPKRE